MSVVTSLSVAAKCYMTLFFAFVHFCFDILLYFHRASAFVQLGPVKGQQFEVIVEAINSDPFSMHPNRGALTTKQIMPRSERYTPRRNSDRQPFVRL